MKPIQIQYAPSRYLLHIRPATKDHPAQLIERPVVLVDAQGQVKAYGMICDVQVKNWAMITAPEALLAGKTFTDAEKYQFFEVMLILLKEPAAVTEHHRVEMEPAVPGAAKGPITIQLNPN